VKGELLFYVKLYSTMGADNIELKRLQTTILNWEEVTEQVHSGPAGGSISKQVGPSGRNQYTISQQKITEKVKEADKNTEPNP
jgi:hypothetical protein